MGDAAMTDRKTITVEIHTLAPVPRRTWTIDPTPDGSRFELHVTPLEECRVCLPRSRRRPKVCRLCRALHCFCCGEDAVPYLAMDHTGGGRVACAACVVSRATEGHCEHEDWREGACALPPGAETHSVARRAR